LILEFTRCLYFARLGDGFRACFFKKMVINCQAAIKMQYLSRNKCLLLKTRDFMKKIATFVILFDLISIGNALSAMASSAQKPAVDIQCFSVIYPKYHTPQYGNPFMVQIKNVSTAPITVHPSISPDIMPKEPILEALKLKSMVGVGALVGITALSGLWTHFLFNVASSAEQIDAQLMAEYPSVQVYDNTAAWAKLSLGVTIFGAAATALCYWNYCTLEADLDQNLLHVPIVLQPGEEVRKYFWLHPAAGIQFDLDAVAVMK
jgi:hypothetical protein